MTHVIYDGPGPGVRLSPAHGAIWCPHGTPIEVPDDVAASLLEQAIWRPHQPRRRTPAAARNNPTVEARPDGTSTETR